MSEATSVQRSERSSSGTRRRPRIGAFFDMDKTIISENSGSVYMKYRYEQGEIDGWDLAKGLGAYLQYKLGILDILTWTKTMMVEFKGRSESDLVDLATDLFEQMILPSVYPEARRCVEWHQRQGHEVCIVSGAARFLAEPLATHLGVQHLVYTRLEIENGRFTGRVIEPICFGEGKVYWLQQFIEDEGIELSKSYFYTDSITDMPLLDLVGYPMIVNPDPILYRMAVRRHWAVRFFEPPESEEADAAKATPAS